MGVATGLRRWFDISQQGHDPHPSELGATPADVQAMARIGRPQKLVRQFKGVSMWSFANTVMVSYITFILLQYTVFPLGGPPLLIWSYVVGAVLFGIIYYAIAGLIPNNPQAGGQMSWVLQYGPKPWRHYLAYTQGWVLVLGWHTYPALVCVTFMSVVNTALLVGGLETPLSAGAQTGISIAAACLAGLINIKFLRLLSYLELVFGLVYVLLAFVITCPVYALAPRRSAVDIFVDFRVFSTYDGYAIPILQGGAIVLSMHIGYDCIIHMVEEIKDAETTAPKALGSSYALNLALLFLVTLAVAICGPDYDPEDPNLWLGYDPLTAVWITIDPKYALGALWSMAGVLFFALVNELACATRMTWSSARDGVMPFSPWLAHTVDGIPIFAAFSTVLSTSGLMTMQLYSPTALAVINSLGAFAVLSSYVVLLSCVAYHRFRFPESETPGRILASYPYVLPGVGAVGAAIMAVFLAFPLATPITAANMNYSWGIFLGVVLLATVWYMVSGKKVFRERLRRRDEACLQYENHPMTYNASHGSAKVPSEHIHSRDGPA